jgi:peroxiredoxin Q/BCP
MPQLKVGDRAPSFSLESDTGERVSLKDLKGKAVVLYFYPKDNTPGCTQQACDFQKAQKHFKKHGAVVLGVSKDSLESHGRFRSKFKLAFPLLSDPEGKVCEAYGVWQEKSLYGRRFMGIVRTTFVIGPDGKIARIYPKVKVTGHIESVLEELGTTVA